MYMYVALCNCYEKRYMCDLVHTRTKHYWLPSAHRFKPILNPLNISHVFSLFRAFETRPDRIGASTSCKGRFNEQGFPSDVKRTKRTSAKNLCWNFVKGKMSQCPAVKVTSASSQSEKNGLRLWVMSISPIHMYTYLWALHKHTVHVHARIETWVLRVCVCTTAYMFYREYLIHLMSSSHWCACTSLVHVKLCS